MDIYIKPAKKTRVTTGDRAVLKDVAEVIAPPSYKKNIEGLTIFHKSGEDQIYLISVTDMVQKIVDKYPECTVNNLGEIDTILEFKEEKKVNRLLKWAKVFFIACVLLTGASTAIMSFHSDAQMYKIFENYNKIFFGVEDQKPYIILVPYSIGIAAGIILFFNHFGGKKITSDPTPIEVEMSLYESDVDETLIDNLSAENESEKKSKAGSGS